MEADEFTRLVGELCSVRRPRGTERRPRGTERRLADELTCHPRTIGRYKSGERSIPSHIADRLRTLWSEEVGKTAAPVLEDSNLRKE